MNAIDYGFGEAIREAMARKGWTQRELARQIPCDRSLVSQWINGHRRPDMESVRAMTGLFNDVDFNFAVARWSTGGLVGNVFDGVAGGRAVAKMCLDREVQEMQEAIAQASATLLRDPDDNDAPDVIHAWINLKELHVAAAEMMRRLAQEYGLGARDLHRAFDERVRGKGYVSRGVA